MNFNQGQMITLDQLLAGSNANAKIKMADHEYRIGDKMHLWLFVPHADAFRFEALVAGFSIIAGQNIDVLVAVRAGDSPFYVITNPRAGVLCQVDELDQAGANEMSQAYWSKVDTMEDMVPREPRDNMAFTHTRAPQSQVDRSGASAAPRAKPSFLSLAVNNEAKAAPPEGVDTGPTCDSAC